MVERLYGVRHGYGTQFAGMTIDETFVAPSEGLMRDLRKLPPGTRVGIEIFPEVWQPFEVQGEINTITEANDFYWGKIQRLCEGRGLNIVYLGDFETYKRYLEKESELRRLVHTALEYEFKNEEVPEEVMQRMYRAHVEAEHMLIFEREKQLFDRIQETQPAVVILGRGHTDPLLLDPQPFNSRGISIGEYRAEEVFTPPLHWNVPEESYYRTYLVYPLRPDKKILLDRDLAKRRHRAVTKGRVMEDRTPDYIGTWDTQVPARGLFEVYFEGDGRTGTIEDCLGTATFFGNIPNGTSFVKRYIPNKSSDEAVRGDVIYVVDSVGKVISGEYRSPHARSGKFNLKKFDGTPYPVNL